MIGFALGLAIFGLYTHHLVNPDNLDPTSDLKEVHSDGSLDYLVRGLHYTFSNENEVLANVSNVSSGYTSVIGTPNVE